MLESDIQKQVFSQKDSSLKEGQLLDNLKMGHLSTCVCWGNQQVAELAVGYLIAQKRQPC